MEATWDESTNARRWEEKLDKIRIDGDLALINLQTERQNVLRLQEELDQLKEELKKSKNDFNKFPMKSAPHELNPKFRHRHLEGLILKEDRLKAAVSDRVTDLLKLRKRIDVTRKNKTELVELQLDLEDQTKETASEIHQLQKEVEVLKNKEQYVKDEMGSIQLEVQKREDCFQEEQQRLMNELATVSKPSKSSPTQSKVPLHSALMHRGQRRHLTNDKKLDLEHTAISFEQKKLLLDELVEMSGIQNLGDLIKMYNEQERIKSELLCDIEAKSLQNALLSEGIAQLEEDIGKFNGSSNVQVTSNGDLRPEDKIYLNRRIKSDETQIAHWLNLSQGYSDSLKQLRDLIRDLFLDLFPGICLEEEALENTINEESTLRKIGAIEERIMHKLLVKILSEIEEENNFETLRRFLQYRANFQKGEGRNERSTHIVNHIAPPSLYGDDSDEKRISYFVEH